jgi:adenylate kinase family enzyme
MAIARWELIEALRSTARKLQASDAYQWGHMGLCNCGFLAQEITHLSKAEIHRRAMERYGDWSEQLNDYCTESGLPMDHLISELLAFGFSAEDLKNLERLSDRAVLEQIPVEKRSLRYNAKADVVLYLNTWASMLEESVLQTVDIREAVSGHQHLVSITEA